MKTIKGGITAPEGFLASGIHSGIKKSAKKDLMLIYSKVPANAAGVFTSNKVKAAPIILSQKNIVSGKAQVIIANSGCANACTGEKGITDARQMVYAISSVLHVPFENILVASTGPIGKLLPMRNIMAGVRILSNSMSKGGGEDAAAAILTTDTRKKEIAVQMTINKKTVKIGGIAKGSGMIHPNMDLPHATMFGFITTDADIPGNMLKSMLKKAVDRSFNSITVDRDTSTNDCVFLLANGMSKCGKLNKKGEEEFYGALIYVCQYLAKEIARDGEGATKLIEVRVEGAKSDEEATEVGRSVAGSDLVKSAMFGCDPNFGRIMAAVGNSKAEVVPDLVDLFIGEYRIMHKCEVVAFNVNALRKYLKKKDIVITVKLGLGKGSATAWGCDLTYDYVKINAEYST